MSHDSSKPKGPISFLFEYSGFLIFGAAAALVWANVDAHSYHAFVHQRIVGGEDHASHGHEGSDHGDSGEDSHHDRDDHVGKSNGHADPHAGEHGSEAAHPEPHATAAHTPTAGDTKPAAKEAQHEPSIAEPEGFIAGIFYRLIHRPNPKTGGLDGITVHFLINDILMALFFAIAGKEVWEALLPGGPLSNPRKAATPLMATLGGILGPVAVYLSGAYFTGTLDTLGNGWAIPCATDIAFSYLVARVVFGAGHPAIAFLLLLAIADDAAGLVILAIAYPSKPIEIQWFIMTALAIGIGFAFRRARMQSFWWYLLIPGTLCWISFDLAGIHPALGLVPIIPCMPHAHTDLGIYAREELKRDDTLNEFEHWFKNPVEVILGLFGLANAGVALGGMGTGTWLVLAGLLIGKPVGITLLTWISEKVFKLEVPAGMGYRHVVSLGTIAAIGFTVALFVSTAAYDATNPALDSLKMGALLSFAAAFIAPIVARLLGVRPIRPGGDEESKQKRPEGDHVSNMESVAV